jgi:hypothetical protein
MLSTCATSAVDVPWLYAAEGRAATTNRMPSTRSSMSGTSGAACSSHSPGGVIALGLVTAIPRPCQKPWCTVPPPASVNKPLVFAGATLTLTSVVFSVRAGRALERALWWHDTSLAR